MHASLRSISSISTTSMSDNVLLPFAFCKDSITYQVALLQRCLTTPVSSMTKLSYPFLASCHFFDTNPLLYSVGWSIPKTQLRTMHFHRRYTNLKASLFLFLMAESFFF